jgi:hypothetical protein
MNNTYWALFCTGFACGALFFSLCLWLVDKYHVKLCKLMLWIDKKRKGL